MALTQIDDRGLKTPIDLLDNEKIRLGTGNDLEIYHQSNENWIKAENGVTNFLLDSWIQFKNKADTETLFRAEPNGAFEAYYDSGKKFETISTGAKISSSAHAYLKVQSSTTSSAVIHLGDTDNDDESQIWYDNYAGGLYLRTSTNTPMVFYTNGTERLRIANDGKVSVGASPIYNFNVRGSGQQTLLVGSTDAGGAYLTLDGDSNGDGQSGDYCSIGHTTAGNLEIVADNPNGDANVIFKAGNAAEAFRIDSAGVVRIGGTSSYNASDKLTLVGTGNTSLTIDATSSTESSVFFADGATGNEAYRGYLQYKHSEDALAIGTSATEALRIDSAGKLLVNCTAPSSGLSGGKMYVETASGVPALVLKHTNDNDGNTIEMQHQRAGANSGAYTGFQVSFRNNAGTQVGSITSTVNATAYNTSSDYRLKENVNLITNGITKVKNLIPKRFNFIADPSKKVIDGFLAHEVATVVPEAVTGEKDEMRSDSEIAIQQLDTSKLIPVLTAALKESIGKIETLETKVAALEAA